MSIRIGMALGAGGARGLCHIGVLTALKEAGVPVHIVTGTSIGAVVGAMYAATEDPEWIQERFRELPESEAYNHSGIQYVKADEPGSEPGFLEAAARYVQHKFVLNLSDHRDGLVKSKRLEDVLRFLLPVDRFDDLALPFACYATDLNSGRPMIHESGDLVKAVLSSAAVPGYIAPVKIQNRTLVDGAIASPLPAGHAYAMGADFVIGVNVSINNFEPLKTENIFSILGRSAEITGAMLSEYIGDQVDVLLHPRGLKAHWTQFDNQEDLVNLGKLTAESGMNTILKAIRKKQRSRRLQTILRIPGR